MTSPSEQGPPRLGVGGRASTHASAAHPRASHEKPVLPSGWAFYPVQLALLAAVYFGAAKLGLTMAFVAEQVTAVWPPTGIALAALLLFGYRVWPGITLGAFLANATANAPLATAAGIALGNTLEALAGAWMLRRLVQFDPALGRVKDVLGLVVLAAGLSTMVSATIGVTSLCLGGVKPWSAYPALWSVWWLGDAMGDLVVAPLLLTWAGWRCIPWRPQRVAEVGVLLLALVAVSLSVFAGPFALLSYPALAYALFPFVIWAALRFGQPPATLATAVASTIAIWGTVHGYGPFHAPTIHESLILLQLFMGVVATTTLVLAAVTTERARAEESLQQSYDLLRAVIEGTTDAVFVKDRQGRYLMINAAGAGFLGKTVAEVIGQDDTQLFSPQTARAIMEGDRRIMATGEIQTYEDVGTAAGVTPHLSLHQGAVPGRAGNHPRRDWHLPRHHRAQAGGGGALAPGRHRRVVRGRHPQQGPGRDHPHLEPGRGEDVWLHRRRDRGPAHLPAGPPRARRRGVGHPGATQAGRAPGEPRDGAPAEGRHADRRLAEHLADGRTRPGGSRGRR